MSSGRRDSITEVTGEVTRALIPATTENEIHRRVCETFATSDLYSVAWIGRVRPENDEIIPEASAGNPEDTLDESSVTEESLPRELVLDAGRTREVTIRRDRVTDSPSQEVREQALKYDCQACGVVPLVYGDTLYGVLYLATARPDGFETAERDSLTELGRTIAYAVETASSPANTATSVRNDEEADLTRPPTEPEQERRLYETIISSTPDLVYAFDLDYRFIFANDALLEMWGLTREESMGKTLREIGYEPWHAEMHKREIDQVVETKESVRGEVGFEHAELGHRIYDYIFAPVLNDEGEVEAITGTTRDVTERKETEEALQKSEERFRALISASSDVVYRMNPDWSEMHQLEGQEFLVDTEEPTSDWLDKYILPDDQERVREAIDEAIRTKSTFEMEHRVEQADGSVGWTFSRAIPMLDEDGDIVEWIGMATDITEQKARERELERALGLLEKTERIADVGGWEIDVETQDVFWSDHIFELLEVDADEEPPLEEALDMYHEADQQIVEEAVEDALNGGDPFDLEVRIRTDSGDVRWLRLQGVPETVDGEAVSLRGAAQDVTDRRKREQRLEAVVEQLEESNERLEQFAYAASHDLQEPLRMVSSYLQLLDSRYGDDLEEEATEFLEFAVDGADRMRRMIEALLQYSRVETRGNPFEPVELDAILDDVLNDLQLQLEEADATVNRESLPRVTGDSDQLRQVFQNLVDNAITYSGGEPPEIDISAERRDTRWVISVSDDGIGIEPEKTDAVFDVFERLHSRDEYPGTGIGLALCQRIIERHEGDIWVESEPDNGSTFSFSLPAADGPTV